MEHSKLVVVLLVVAILCLVVTITLLISLNTIELTPIEAQSASSSPGGNIQFVVLPQESLSNEDLS